MKNNSYKTLSTSTQTTMERATPSVGKRGIKPIILGVTLFITVTLSLFNVFFDRYSNEYITNYNDYPLIISQRDSTQNALLNSLEKGEIDKALFISRFKLNKKQFNNRLKSYTKKHKELKAKHSFLGRSSFKFWSYSFGLVLGYLFFAISNLKNNITKGSTYKLHYIDLSGIVVGIFWTIHHLFFTQEDFNNNKYVIVIITCAILCTIATYNIVKYYTYKDNIIRTLLDFIKRMKNKHYIDVAVKAKYAEQYNKALPDTKTVKEHADALDKDIDKTFNQLL